MVGVLVFTAYVPLVLLVRRPCVHEWIQLRGDGLGLTASVLVCVGGVVGAAAGFCSGVTSVVTGKMVAPLFRAAWAQGVLMSLAVNHSVASRRPCRTPLKGEHVFIAVRNG